MRKYCPHCGKELKVYAQYNKTIPHGASQRPRLSFRRTKWACINHVCIFKKKEKVAFKMYSNFDEQVRDDRQ